MSFFIPAPSVTNIEWQTYGFADNGTWYVAGQPPLGNPTAVQIDILPGVIPTALLGLMHLLTLLASLGELLAAT